MTEKETSAKTTEQLYLELIAAAAAVTQRASERAVQARDPDLLPLLGDIAAGALHFPVQVRYSIAELPELQIKAIMVRTDTGKIVGELVNWKAVPQPVANN